MTIYEIIILALALSADAFAVGAVVGLRHRKFRQIFRLSFHFGLFQAIMPFIGVYIGKLIISYVRDWDHWVVFLLLAFIGGKMIFEAYRDSEEKGAKALDVTRGLSLVSLSIAVSLDAFAAGISLTAANAPIALSITIIGFTAAFTTALAMVFSKFVELWIGKYCEVLGGLVLIGLGFKILLEHFNVINL